MVTMRDTLEYKDLAEQFIVSEGSLTVNAPAKINLSLLIAGKRPDGYHEINTIMAKINLFDKIHIEKAALPGLHLKVTGPKWAPEGKENLVYQAAEKILTACSCSTPLQVTLEKNIPAGTGLGSASSDAAATLLGVRKFLDLQISDEKLAEIASSLGSDVPFFLGGPLAICTGRGEKLQEIEQEFNFLAVIIIPHISVSTAEVYRNYKHDNDTYCTLDHKINAFLCEKRIDFIYQMCTNMLEVSCFSMNKKLADLKTDIENSGIRPVCLSGSGSAMFHIIKDGDLSIARHYKAVIQQKSGCDCIIVNNIRW